MPDPLQEDTLGFDCHVKRAVEVPERARELLPPKSVVFSHRKRIHR